MKLISPRFIKFLFILPRDDLSFICSNSFEIPAMYAPCGHTDTCENITFPQLLLWTVVNLGSSFPVWIHYWNDNEEDTTYSSVACHLKAVNQLAYFWHSTSMPGSDELTMT